MNHLQIWLQNHDRRLTQDAIDEVLMEYIISVEKQRDELLAAIEFARDKISELHLEAGDGDCHYPIVDDAIASVKGATK